MGPWKLKGFKISFLMWIWAKLGQKQVHKHRVCQKKSACLRVQTPSMFCISFNILFSVPCKETAGAKPWCTDASDATREKKTFPPHFQLSTGHLNSSVVRGGILALPRAAEGLSVNHSTAATHKLGFVIYSSVLPASKRQWNINISNFQTMCD